MKTRNFSTRLVSVVIALTMLMSIAPAFSVLAREYAADLSINGVTVAFENQAYSKNDILYVPLEELGKYLNLQITREGDICTVVRLGKTTKVQLGNMVVSVDGKSVTLSSHPEEKNGAIYVPVDLFSTGFGCPLTIAEDKRSADLVPNVYTVSINESQAAAVSAAAPDKDILATGTSGVDTIFNNPAVFPTLEKSVFYMIDLSAFSGLKLQKVMLALNIDKAEYSPTLRIERTAPWKKGEVTYNTQPVSYEGEAVTGLVAESNYVDKQYNITTLVNNADKAGEALAIKLLGIPHSSKKNSSKDSFTIRGVNHAKAPYVIVYLEEEYTFPVKIDSAEEDSSESKYSELALLKSLGVFTENDEFPLDLNEGVQRQEFVKYALRLRNTPATSGSGELFFSDVPVDAPFYNDVMTAHSLGLVAGWQGIEFRPYDRITIGEAITILGRMLNYNIYADERGGFTPGYFAAARQGKLYLGSASEYGELSFKKMISLFEDALDAKMLDVRTYHSDGSAKYIFNENMTILSEYWDAKKIEGIVTANEYSNIDPDPELDGKDDTLKIGEKELKLKFEPYNQFLGFKVRGWYNSEDELLYLGILESSITEVNLEDIEGTGDSASTVTFTYKKENGKRANESFSRENVIYNGKSIAPENVTSALLNADAGSVKLVGTTLAVITAYDTVTVYSVEPDEEIIYDKYDSYNNVLRLKGKDYTIRDNSGKDISLDSIAVDDILSVAKSLDGELISAVLSNRKITGTISMVENLGTKDQVLTIGAAEYKTRNLDRIVEDSIKEYWTDYIRIGANGTFLLDAFGNIVGFNPTRTTDVKGYILTMDTAGGSALSKKLQAAIMVEGSLNYVIYDLADKVEVDGRKRNTTDKILDCFYDFDVDGNRVGDFIKQGIIFDLNADGKISSIDTSYFDEEYEDEDNSLHLRRSISDGTLTYKSSGSWGGKYYVKLSKGLGVVCYDEDKFDEYETRTGGLVDKEPYAFDLYTIGKETPEAAIAYRVIDNRSDSSVGDDPKLMLVDKVVTAFDSDGFEIKKLYYYSGTSRSSVTVPDEMIPKLKAKVADSSDEEAYAADPGNAKVIDEISRGDIIRLEADDRGELTAIEEAYDYETKTIRDNKISNFNSLIRTYGGYTGLVSGTYIKITSTGDISDEGTYTWMDSSKFSNFCRYEVTSTGVDVIPATLADVRSVKNVPEDPTGVLLQAAYENLRANVWMIELNPPDIGRWTLTYNLGEYGESYNGVPEKFVRSDSEGNIEVTEETPIGKRDTSRNIAYEFTHWEDEEGNEITAPASMTLTEHTTLTAQWREIELPYYIYLKKNAGDAEAGSIIRVDKTAGVYTTTVPNVKKSNGDYYFTESGKNYVEWVDGEGVVYTPGAELTLEGDLTLYPDWYPEVTETFNNDKFEILKVAQTTDATQTISRLTMGGSNDGNGNSKRWYLVKVDVGEDWRGFTSIKSSFRVTAIKGLNYSYITSLTKADYDIAAAAVGTTVDNFLSEPSVVAADTEDMWKDGSGFSSSTSKQTLTFTLAEGQYTYSDGCLYFAFQATSDSTSNRYAGLRVADNSYFKTTVTGGKTE